MPKVFLKRLVSTEGTDLSVVHLLQFAYFWYISALPAVPFQLFVVARQRKKFSDPSFMGQCFDPRRHTTMMTILPKSNKKVILYFTELRYL